jgi:hypothetical protein
VCLSPSTIPWNAASYFPNAEFGNYDIQDSTAAFYNRNSNSNSSGLFLLVSMMVAQTMMALII